MHSQMARASQISHSSHIPGTTPSPWPLRSPSSGRSTSNSFVVRHSTLEQQWCSHRQHPQHNAAKHTAPMCRCTHSRCTHPTHNKDKAKHNPQQQHTGVYPAGHTAHTSHTRIRPNTTHNRNAQVHTQQHTQPTQHTHHGCGQTQHTTETRRCIHSSTHSTHSMDAHTAEILRSQQAHNRCHAACLGNEGSTAATGTHCLGHHHIIVVVIQVELTIQAILSHQQLGPSSLRSPVKVVHTNSQQQRLDACSAAARCGESKVLTQGVDQEMAKIARRWQGGDKEVTRG
jgi:hypothetical protein